MKRLDSDHYVFSTGRTLCANNGFIGLSGNRDGDEYRQDSACGFDLSEGYDGRIWARAADNENRDPDEVTTDELIELAEFMVDEWLELLRRATDRRAGERAEATKV